MLVALTLLVAALSIVLYRDRDFWFPDTEEAEDQFDGALSTTSATAAPPAKGQHQTATRKKRHTGLPAKQTAAETSAPPIVATTTRTVLPPLEVEVVAGDVHRTVHPGSNSIHVDLQPGSAPQAVAAPPVAGTNEYAASVTNNAAERVQMSADTADIVTSPVKPGYPLLARQMKVQGSVILQALIGRDGLIQGLHIVSGPPILASAAREAVKQWHFKPHYQGSEAVETQAKITVNFTISTN